MSANNPFRLSNESLSTRGGNLRPIYAILKTISFVVMVEHFGIAARSACDTLPFSWQMLTYLLAGCLFPLTLIGCIALISALFWHQDSR